MRTNGVARRPGCRPTRSRRSSAGLPTSFDDEREQVVYEMATALANARWVPKGLYDRAVKALGHVGITDVITLDGLLHQRRDDARLLRRAGRRDRHGALTQLPQFGGRVNFSFAVLSSDLGRDGVNGGSLWRSAWRSEEVGAERPCSANFG